MVKFAVTFVIANIFCIFVFVMYKEDSFNIVAPLELGPFWGDVKSEDFFFVASKYSGIWDSSVMSLTAYNETPCCSRFTDKC